MAQDASGFLWAGTEDGLYRYDGQRFQQVGKGLKSTTIWELSPTPRGPWVSTDEGLFRLEGGVFVPVAGARSGRPDFFQVSGEGEAIAVYADGVYSGREGSSTWPILKRLPEPATAGWASKDLRTLLLRTGSSLWKFEHAAWTSVAMPASQGNTRGRIFRDSKGGVWLRTRSGLFRKRTWDDPWQDLTGKLPGNAVNANALVEDALGRVWVGSSKGLLCVDGEDSWVLDEAKGLPGGWAAVLFVDREGSLWVGSEGLHRLCGRFLWTGFGTHQGLPSPSVWDLGRAKDGKVYACTDQGVAVLEGEAWKVLPATRNKTLFAGAEDGNGGLWFGGATHGRNFNELYRMDLRTQHLETISLQPCAASSAVLALAPDGMGGVYAGTLDHGLFQVKREGSHWKTAAIPFPEVGSTERINSLVRDGQGHVWAAAQHGLFVLDGGRWLRLGPRQGLPGTNCFSLARDAQDRVWVAFGDARGIARIGQATSGWQALEVLTAPVQLFEDAILSMTFTGDKVLWLGTDAGMKRWDGAYLETFGKGEGLPSVDPSANAIFPDHDGGLWQGFSNGIGHFDPKAFRGTPAPPEAKILDAGGARNAIELDPALGVTRIPYRDRTIVFHFSALSFLNETRLVHQVRLVGLEDEWRETQIAEARYPALAAGAYRFEVRSRNADGEPGPIASVAFEILPPWWGTWWFRTLAGVGLLGLAGLLYRWRVRQLFHRTMVLEAMVQARTESLERANQALEQATLVDPLTGLHNRRFLDLSLPTDALQAQRAFKELLEAGKDPLAPKEDLLLFMMDIDHFKLVNDTYGHLAGDAVLIQLAVALKQATRATDSVVRWGGEEFLLVARRARRSGAPKIAQTILETVRALTFELPGGERIKKQLSIGFTALPLHPMHPDLGSWQLGLQLADQCLYAAKERGRDMWVGALLKADQDPALLARHDTWDIPLADQYGLIELFSSHPGFTWPSSSAKPDQETT